MTRENIALIWRRPPPADTVEQLRNCIDRACGRALAPVCVFFRNDDVAVPGAQFERMMRLFQNLAVPISLAVVPAWLTQCRWRQIRERFDGGSDLWCWHQHGWRHANHEEEGKKQEFGPSRSPAQLRSDLVRGRTRLEDILGRNFYPVFTPPWNRCSSETLHIIAGLGYKAVSRSQSAPSPPPALKDLPVRLDLHTRKDEQFFPAWRLFLQEFESSLDTRRCGIMLHHRRMNAAAFSFLEELLILLVAHPKVRLVNFRDLLENAHAKTPSRKE